MIFLFFLFACSSASSDLGNAKRVEEQGQVAEAFDLYVAIKQKYPDSLAAKQADKSLKRIYLRYATSKAVSEPDTAIAIYKMMAKRWPNEEIGRHATAEIETISASKVAQEQVTHEENRFCTKAQEAKSRVLWQQYKQNYPTGACVQEADEFLAVAQPRERELEAMVELGQRCAGRLASACAEYNLAKTTSMETICKDANQAFQKEFQRLRQRKEDLLAEGNQEYYENFILKRWDSVFDGLQTACAESNQYLMDKEAEGIDVAALKEVLQGSCSVCTDDIEEIR